MVEQRIRNHHLIQKIMSPNEASLLIKDGMNIATSGFTLSSYPKAVALALVERLKKSGEKIRIGLYTGASVGEELDGILAQEDFLCRRYPYQTNESLRKRINAGTCAYTDMHLSHFSQYVKNGFVPKVDLAIIEAVAITEEGNLIPGNSLGGSPTFVEMADQVIVEINLSHPLGFEGMADVYSVEKPPFRKPIMITKPDDRIGTTYIPCTPEKIAAVVITDIPDQGKKFAAVDETSQQISQHLIDFLKQEVSAGRLPENLLPIQSGVGSVANAVLAGLKESSFENLWVYTEVVQDAVLDLIDVGKVKAASTTAVSPSPEGLKKFKENIDFYRDKIILRPMEISNNPEVIRRLGVLAFNTAIEADIYGNVNSTNIMGSRIMNGIGGSGDFARNAYISVFTTPSTAKGGAISSIVPMVSHHDHTEHDVMVIVTERGFADLRGLCPKERAKTIIEKCAHPDYQPMLWDYFERACKGKFQHTPHVLDEALSWHKRLLDTGNMKAE
ncbi:acetyl-CoA hydrolase/transferase family protein [Candidatus Formimonas warabiya]|uniref:Acetyl-CoA hydrolase n=1 Tax=Formimonas warabiya TaxID=1761012 RepID=A0A3G1KM11_FORW1|nr:acetyl-CoA hydrolase/transferase family protein [Candidatus Formimonas warabiya]ATW23458.1 acetyl-CoA hydrolase [Candidatus Formimonas warabiya]